MAHQGQSRRPTVNFAPELPEELRVYVPFQRTSHIYRLFLYWEYQLGILPKGTTYQPTSPFMREELRKLDEITGCRKKLKLNTGVEQRSIKIQDTLDMVYTNEEQHRAMAHERAKGARYR